MSSVDNEGDVRYASSGDARLAFRVRSRGPHQIVNVPTFMSNQDFQAPAGTRTFWERLYSFATVLSYDARGTGLSDPLSLTDLPTLESWTDDLDAVVTAAGLQRVTLLAHGSAGPVAAMYAATRPTRTLALILVNTFARIARSDDYEIGATPEQYERVVEHIEEMWGTGRFLRGLMPDVRFDDAMQRDVARLERQAMAPAAVGQIFRQQYAMDVRAVLPHISAPTLVLHTVENRVIPVELGRYLAQHIPNAHLVELPGADSIVTTDSAVAPLAIDEIEEFITGARAAADQTRMLTTLLFTDVVGSTDRVAAIGDRAWRVVLDRYDDAVRHQLKRFAGREEKSTGDGVFATFDGPASAIRCGVAIRDAARQIGLEVRVGIHTGEVERRGSELAGIAVHLAHRVCQASQPAEVLVTRTVVDLVAGSDINFADRGEHNLKGMPTTWRLFAVTT
jgi:class 3 adenylate cyclase